MNDVSDPNLPDRAFELGRNNLINGWNCSQSVYRAIMELLGSHDPMALKAATGFAGGIGNSGAFCGACAGGVMVLGTMYGRENLIQAREKEATYLYCAEWYRRYMEHFKTCNCREILGVDLSDPPTRKSYWASGDNRENCAELRVGTSARMLMRLIQEIESDPGTWQQKGEKA
jgi:C_GCAxxG_C_C family probable redox protein